MNDRFKFIRGFEKYLACVDGHIYSSNYNKTGKTKQLKEQLDKDGYPYVRLSVNGKHYKKKVHRLIAESFLDKIDEKHQVNHKNGIKTDNMVENLEWCSCRDNIIHAYRVLGKKPTEKMILDFKKRISGVNNPKSKINPDIAQNIRKDRKSGLMLKELSRKYNLSVSQIGHICKNKFWNIHSNPELLEKE